VELFFLFLAQILSLAAFYFYFRKKIQDAIGALSHLDGKQKEQVWGLLERFLNQKPGTESVTLVS